MIEAVPNGLVDIMAITGTPEEARQRFSEDFQDLYEHTLLYSPSFGLSDQRFSDNLHGIIETFGR